MTDLILQIGGIEDFDCTLEFYVERDKSVAISKSQLNGVTIGGRTQYYAVIDADRVGRGHLMCRVELNEREGSKMRHVTVSGYTGCTIPCVGTGGHIECSGYRISFQAVQDIPHADGSVLHGVTYAELKAMRDSGNLVPMEKYRITDYVTTTAQEDTMSANHSFDVIVEALTEWDLSERAQACQHKGDGYFDDVNLGAWQIWYDIENDTNKYAWADAENGKGVIYRIIDEHGNDCPYDFKNILFGERYTFCWQDDWENDLSLSGRCRNNVIKEYYRNGKRALNNVCFSAAYRAEITNCFFDVDCHDICIYGGGRNISVGYGSHDLQIEDGAVNVRIGKSCFDIILSPDCDDISIGDSCYNITVPDEYNCIHIGNGCGNINGRKVPQSKIQIMPGVGGKSDTEMLTMQSSNITDDVNVYYADGQGGYYSSSHGDLVTAIAQNENDHKELAIQILTLNGRVQDNEEAIAQNESKINDVEKSVNALFEAETTLDDKIDTKHNEALGVIGSEVEKLKDGDTIVGQAREIHSKNGKTVTDSFLARTTAGSGTVGDGVATLKSVGGNIVKKLVDSDWGFGSNLGNWQRMGDVTYNINGDFINVNFNTPWLGIQTVQNLISSHKYYMAVYALGNLTNLVLRCGEMFKEFKLVGIWRFTSNIFSELSSDLHVCSIQATNAGEATLYNPILIDLTEMFGAGNEPSKEECDKLFGTMDALPQGLSIANPTEFKSTGFNQFNPAFVKEGKTIVDNAIVDGDKKLAIIPCLPCKIGVGENNGYCIHGEFGEDIKVYLTPLNPMEVEGELYMHELVKDETSNTYVSQIKGYMIVEVPDTTNLCVHLKWSADVDEYHYEPYHESVVELPTIPEMPEYGLAGIQSSSTLVCDEIDFVKGVYRKKIGCVDLGSLNWIKRSESNLTGFFNAYIYPSQVNIHGIVSEKYVYVGKNYSTIGAFSNGNTAADNIYSFATTNNLIYIKATSYNDIASFQSAMQGVMLYYELAEPIEYPLPKVDNSYISSDYGVEKFDSLVPCNANNLYYMRSLAGETRNFLDKMYSNTGKESANEVADYITDNIAENKAKAEEAPNLALRALFVAAGAEYNDTDAVITKTAPWGDSVEHLPKHYYLNGLGDITEAQMTAIYNAPYNIKSQGAYEGQKIRTACFYPDYGWVPYNLSLLFSNSEIEVFGTPVTRWGAKVETLSTSDVSYMFLNCGKLRYCNLIINGAKTLTGVVQGCANLELFRIKGVKSNLTLSACHKISKESVLYAIQNATPTSAITITLHSDAYARLASDADIVTALEEKNAALAAEGKGGSVSLVSA